MADNILLSVAGNIATITLNAPPLNLVSLEMTRALSDALDRCTTDEAVRVLIVTGAGERAFCGGSDIKEFPSLMAPGVAVERKLAFENETYTKLARFRAPTIAAINGLALGGGLELATCCDFVIAEEGVMLGLPESKLGIFPGSGGTIRAARRIGAARAKRLIYLGDPIGADTALAWGLVDELAPRGQALAHGRALAERLRLCSATGLRLAKRSIDTAPEETEEQAVSRMLGLMDEAFCAADVKEGVSAFLAKRKPDFLS